jgi:putative phosphoserine phosphatase / 1-acylglycerol-3-phosphate O-acyltransferase
VAKKEAIFSPAGPVMWLADVAFLDRGDPERAKAALRPAVQRLRDGVSVAIAPEGTRSVTPRLGQFKKGAFHLAIEAEVPIVPVVLRNVGEAMWRNAKTMRPATVEVHVHEPVDVRGWDPRNLNGDVEDVRRLYLETLERWPSRGANVGVA